MTQNQYVQLIKDLSDANGVSGFEDEVLAVARRHLAATDSGQSRIHEDKMRNLYLERTDNRAPLDEKRGGRPRVLLDAHSDEVGFMVQAIDARGLLRLVPLGGWVPYNASAQRVRVGRRDGGYVRGLIASTPPHYRAERDAAPKIEALRVDLGASSAEESRESYGVGIGSPVIPDVRCEYDAEHGIFMGKAFDCRIGCAALLATWDALRGKDLAVDLLASLSAQEEVGIRGAVVAAARVKPDLAICFEGGPADDTLGENSVRQTVLGRGPMLRHMDVRAITHPRFQRFALDLAAARGIAIQEGVRDGGGTNASAIHISGLGVPTLVLSVPVRYAHTHYGLVAYRDFAETVRLATEIVAALNQEVYDAL